MNENVLILATWCAWLIGIGAIAFWRYDVVQKDKRERDTRRSERSDRRPNSSGHAEENADPDETQRVRPLGAEYRQQLIAAGLLKPAAEPPAPEQSA